MLQALREQFLWTLPSETQENKHTTCKLKFPSEDSWVQASTDFQAHITNCLILNQLATCPGLSAVVEQYRHNFKVCCSRWLDFQLYLISEKAGKILLWKVFPTSRGMTKIQLHNKCSVILEKYSDSLGQRQMHHFHLLISVIRPRNSWISFRVK